MLTCTECMLRGLALRMASLLGACLLLVNAASAALIDNDNSVLDTGSGLEWMKLSETFGMQYTDVHSQLQLGGEWEGWRFATGAEFENLLIGQGAVAGNCANGTQFCGFTPGTEGNWSVDFNHLFGDTYYQGFPYPYQQSAGLLADLDPASGHHWTALILTDYDTAIGDHRGFIETHAWSSADNSYGASWLVREAIASPGTNTFVPLPAAAQFYAMGLVAFMILRRSVPA